MIVCHCHAVTDRAILACAREGACSLEDIAERTGAGTCCGGCHGAVEELLDEAFNASSPGQVAVRHLPMAREPPRAA